LGEARSDALRWASANIDYYRFARFLRIENDPEEIKMEDDARLRWELAVDEAKRNDWSKIITNIQQDAQLAFGHSHRIQRIIEEPATAQQRAEESEEEAHRWINFARSLQQP
jgi:hypothetical protein